MKTEARNFDMDAPAWDDVPRRARLAADVASAIIKQVNPDKTMHMLDFGCGTGLISLHLQSKVKEVTCVDNSRGMLEVLRRKIADEGLNHVHARLVDVEAGDVLSGCYDLIVSSMTLHHIEGVERLVGQFFRVLNPGGYICIADLDSENGQFHSDNAGVFHKGFDREMLCAVFRRAGFARVAVNDAAVVEKTTDDGETVFYSVFLLSGMKPVKMA